MYAGRAGDIRVLGFVCVRRFFGRSDGTREGGRSGFVYDKLAISVR